MDPYLYSFFELNIVALRFNDFSDGTNSIIKAMSIDFILVFSLRDLCCFAETLEQSLRVDGELVLRSTLSKNSYSIASSLSYGAN
jgi:hypothetical protein